MPEFSACCQREPNPRLADRHLMLPDQLESRFLQTLKALERLKKHIWLHKIFLGPGMALVLLAKFLQLLLPRIGR